MGGAGTPQENFQRRGIIEGFFGPIWSMAHRKALLRFGADRGMTTYVYAPKDDPYHRSRWMEPYPRAAWRSLQTVIAFAHHCRIEFVYAFHPGQGLRFSASRPIRTLLEKAGRFVDAGVRTFAVLFDDIPSRLEHARDRTSFDNSLARAEAQWLARVQERQPSSWRSVEWWLCPSYYTIDPMLPRLFGSFESDFLEVLGEFLPPQVSCFWTGPRVVSRSISLAHVRAVRQRLGRPLLLWDNYPVNDLSMKDEMHLAPLTGRDPRLPRFVDGYFANPLLQEALSFVPLATCLDYASNPATYDPEASWSKAVTERFGHAAVRHWRVIRSFCERLENAKRAGQTPRLPPGEVKALRSACRYVRRHRSEKWARELRPWFELMEEASRKL